MSDEAIKKRLADAKESAKIKCQELGYEITNSDNYIFCFTASRAGIYERKIRVVIDEATKEDLGLILNARIMINQTKEIWCRQFGSRQWRIIAFDHLNNTCQ